MEDNKNERYNDNSYISNGYSFYTNKNLLNTSMSPIHKIGSQCTLKKDDKPLANRIVRSSNMNFLDW